MPKFIKYQGRIYRFVAKAKKVDASKIEKLLIAAIESDWDSFEYSGVRVSWKPAPLNEPHTRYTIRGPGGSIQLDQLGQPRALHAEDLAHQIDEVSR